MAEATTGRTCRKCLSTDITEGNLRKRNYLCRSCDHQFRSATREHQKFRHKQYNASIPGIARQLVSSHNYPKAEALLLAESLIADDVRCEICGIPGWLVKLNYSKGGPFFMGTPRTHARFHPDRINTRLPHTFSNTRILCATCNLRRGAERYSDKEVLHWVRDRWLSIFPTRLLWWLNTSPGEGGRPYRSPSCQMRDARFARMRPTGSNTDSSLVEDAW